MIRKEKLNRCLTQVIVNLCVLYMTTFLEHKQVNALFVALYNCLSYNVLDKGNAGNYESKSYHATIEF